MKREDNFRILYMALVMLPSHVRWPGPVNPWGM